MGSHAHYTSSGPRPALTHCILTHRYGEALKVAVVAAAMAGPQLQDRARARIIMVPQVQLVTEAKTPSPPVAAPAGSVSPAEEEVAGGKAAASSTKTFGVVELTLHKRQLVPVPQ